MKVLLITPIFPPQKGGGAEDFYKIAKTLYSIGVKDITVISYKIQNRKESETYGRFFVKRELRPETSIIEEFFIAENIIKKELSRLKYDILIVHSNILTLRMFYKRLFENFKGKLILFKSDFVPIYDYSIFDEIISISEGIYNFLLKDGAPKKKIVKLPILYKKPSPEKNGRKFLLEKYMFFPGGTNQIKGAYALFKAFFFLKEETKSPVKLIVAGAGIKYTDFNKDIHFLGPTPKKDMIEWIKGAEIVVLPSYTEGLPRTILDAISLKKPILFTKGIVPEFDFLDKKHLIETIDPSEIKEKIKKLLLSDKDDLNYKPVEEIIGSSNPEKEWKNYFKNLFNNIKNTLSTNLKNNKKEYNIIPEKFWGKEVNKFLLYTIETFTSKKKAFPLNCIIKTIENLKFKDSELILKVGDIYFQHNHKKEAKTLYKKALNYYPQYSAFLSFTRLIFNYPLSIEDKVLIKNFINNLKENYSENKLFDFIIERLINFSKTEFKKYLNFEKKIIVGKLKEFFIKKEINKTRNFINLYSSGEYEESLLKYSLELFEKMRGKSSYDYFKIGVLYKNHLKENNKASFWFKKFLTKSNDLNLLSISYFYLGEIEKLSGRKDWKKYLLNGINILKNKKRKSHPEIYRLASAYKKLNDLKKARLYFKKLINKSNDKNLLAGAYFHSGEMELQSGNTKNALSYFKECLELNPEHGKAKEYLENNSNENCIY